MSDPRLASAHLHADVERLRAQALLSWPKEAQALERLGLRDGMSVLEVGSGPGFVTEAVLRALPRARVTAVELDPGMNHLATTHLANYLGTRCEIIQASILGSDLPDDAFDFAICRYVFQHLVAPLLAAREILRLLKPGGAIAILDIDDEMGGLVTPFLPELAFVGQKVRQVQAARAGDRQIGRKLWRLLAQAGFEDLALDVVAFHSDELGVEPFLPQIHPDRFRPFVMPGGLAEEDWQRYRAAYDSFLAGPRPFILQLIMLVSGKKPPRTPA